jgi:hypothetical protein
VQAVIDAVNESGGSGGIGNKVEDDKEDQSPRYDPSDHVITSRRALMRAMRGARGCRDSGYSPT